MWRGGEGSTRFEFLFSGGTSGRENGGRRPARKLVKECGVRWWRPDPGHATTTRAQKRGARVRRGSWREVVRATGETREVGDVTGAAGTRGPGPRRGVQVSDSPSSFPEREDVDGLGSSRVLDATLVRLHSLLVVK